MWIMAFIEKNYILTCDWYKNLKIKQQKQDTLQIRLETSE